MVLAGAFGGGDHEHEVGGAVLGTEVHRRVQSGHREAGFGDRLGAGVRDGDASGNTCRGLLFAGDRRGGQPVG